MKAKILLITMAVLLSPAALQAQSYSIDWFSIDGGSGTSTGGPFSMSGTIGQPDAGPTMTSGNYSLTGGFWALCALQVPGSPLLKISVTSTNTILISWPSPSVGFVLQQNADLSPGNWITAPQPITDDGTNKYILFSAPTGNRFYRLVR
jgi:hypothetical protein